MDDNDTGSEQVSTAVVERIAELIKEEKTSVMTCYSLAQVILAAKTHKLPGGENLLNVAGQQIVTLLSNSSRGEEKELSDDELLLVALLLVRVGDADVLATFLSMVLRSSKPEAVELLVLSLRRELGDDSVKTIPMVRGLVMADLKWLEGMVMKGVPRNDWRMSRARVKCLEQPRLQEFLRSNQTTTRLTGFRILPDAREFAKNSVAPEFCSFTMKAGGGGSSAYVKVSKTDEWHGQHVKQYNDRVKERDALRVLVGNGDEQPPQLEKGHSHPRDEDAEVQNLANKKPKVEIIDLS